MLVKGATGQRVVNQKLIIKLCFGSNVMIVFTRIRQDYFSDTEAIMISMVNASVFAM